MSFASTLATPGSALARSATLLRGSTLGAMSRTVGIVLGAGALAAVYQLTHEETRAALNEWRRRSQYRTARHEALLILLISSTLSLPLQERLLGSRDRADAECAAPHQALRQYPADTPNSQKTLWHAVNEANLAFRQPLYHEYLGKPAPKQKLRDAAVQNGLAILSAFAGAVGTKQVIVTSANGYVRSISFQPRPFDFCWTARFGMAPLEQLTGHDVGIDAMLFMAAKTTCAAAHYQWEHMPDATATLMFDHLGNLPTATLLVRETSSREHRAALAL
jgi:hypothetical protein